MDFSCSSFPDHNIHISLYRLADENTSTDDLSIRRGKLIELVK